MYELLENTHGMDAFCVPCADEHRIFWLDLSIVLESFETRYKRRVSRLTLPTFKTANGNSKFLEINGHQPRCQSRDKVRLNAFWIYGIPHVCNFFLNNSLPGRSCLAELWEPFSSRRLRHFARPVSRHRLA